MVMTAPAYQHNGVPVSAERFYEIACDPRRSVAVEACAGAGKTWMLVSRILRALLDGAQPHEILAITFTKKAAGEMRQRLHEWLTQFATASPDQLVRELAMRGVANAGAAEVEALRSLYARVLATGRPVQVRTFHSWFAALLRNAPLALMEAMGLPPNYELLEDDSEAVELVWRRFHVTVSADPQARADYEACVAAHGRSQTQKGLTAALSKRVEFLLALEYGAVEKGIRHFGEQFPRFAGLEFPEQSLDGDVARARWHARSRALGAEANKTPQKAARGVVDAFRETDLGVRAALLRKAFFVTAEDRLTQNLARFSAAQEAEEELHALCAAQSQHAAWLYHHRMARLAVILVAEFSGLKRERGWVDMNDVERAAQAMLSDDVLSGWVQEKLDARVKHLLIDEFQDTNPLQWQALHSWLGAYAGAGGSRPGVFIVGDPKQSIYRFRRAEPQVFFAAKNFIRDAFEGDVLSCDHTHRNAPEVIAVVNAVMAQAQSQGQYDGFRRHTTQSEAIGTVNSLPRIAREAVKSKSTAREAADDEPLAWRDSLTVPREVQEEKLVSLECRQAAAWIANAIAAGTPANAIMVLARKRDRLAAMEDELRKLHIASQQPERQNLCEAPEVQDIVALLDALVSPAHDLSLARALKSPLFGVTDEDLVSLALAARRARTEERSTSWSELLRHDDSLGEPLRAIGRQLQAWKALVDTLPPHDALDQIYHTGKVVVNFAAAAPAPLRDAVVKNLKALLGAALEVDGGRYATPYGFVRALRSQRIQAPALSATAAVQLLTVHGAKGLEAPIVVMLDTESGPGRSETMGVLVEWPGEAPAPWRFAFIASESRPPPSAIDALEVEQGERHREELNALYVAMTRARRHLVISSVEPYTSTTATWRERLGPHCQPLETPQRPPVATAPAATTFTLPELPPVTVTPLPLRGGKDERDPDSERSRFGEAMHRLLEGFGGGSPRFTPAALRRVAREFSLTQGATQQAARLAEAILGGEGAWAWDEAVVDWQGNEVPMQHEGELRRLDRLVRRSDTGDWWVLDYKSAARPENDEALLEQMRAYRAAVREANPGSIVHAAFLTGQGRLVRVE